MNLSRLLLVSLLICPSLQADNLPPVDENVQALRVLEQQLGAGRLADAERQLQGLQQRIPGDTRLQGARRLLAAAYLAQGRRHLASGDLAAAGQARGDPQWLRLFNPRHRPSIHWHRGVPPCD